MNNKKSYKNCKIVIAMRDMFNMDIVLVKIHHNKTVRKGRE